LGRAYKDVPEVSSLVGTVGRGSRGIVAGTGESDAVAFITGFSKDGSQYVDYVPRPMPRGTQNSIKRGPVDSSSTSAPASKKPRQSGVPIIGSMLVGEHIIVFFSFFLFGLLVTRVLYVSDGKLVGLVENEEDDTPLIARQ
jgi:hypothetical protein